MISSGAGISSQSSEPPVNRSLLEVAIEAQEERSTTPSSQSSSPSSSSSSSSSKVEASRVSRQVSPEKSTQPVREEAASEVVSSFEIRRLSSTHMATTGSAELAAESTTSTGNNAAEDSAVISPTEYETIIMDVEVPDGGTSPSKFIHFLANQFISRGLVAPGSKAFFEPFRASFYGALRPLLLRLLSRR